MCNLPRKKAALESVDSEGDTLLHKLCNEQSFRNYVKTNDLVKYILDFYKTEDERYKALTTPNKIGRCPIQMSCERGSFEHIPIMLNAVPNYKNNLVDLVDAEGNTLLHFTYFERIYGNWNSSTLALELLEGLFGKDEKSRLSALNRKNNNGDTPITLVYNDVTPGITFYKLFGSFSPFSKFKFFVQHPIMCTNILPQYPILFLLVCTAAIGVILACTYAIPSITINSYTITDGLSHLYARISTTV